jgi:gliding motility-associated-like protein
MFLIILLFLSSKLTFGMNTTSKTQECIAPSIEPKGKLFLYGSNEINLFAYSEFSEYQWYQNEALIEGATSSRLVVKEPGLYKVIGSNESGCKIASEATEVLSVKNEDPLPFENILSSNGVRTEKGFRFCPGESLEITVVGNFYSYLWTGGENNLTSTVTISEPGTYELAARVTPECALVQTIVVTTFTAPSVKIESSDTVFRSGQSILLNASGAETYSWFPSEGLNNPNIPNPIASPVKTTTYQVTGTGSNGCSNTSEITLFVDGGEINLYPPKVFSANREEFWEIDNIEAYPNLELVIFNRQGLEVFKSNPYLNNWNASYRGAPLPKGDYYFVMRGQGERNFKTGSILLLR